MSQCKEHFPHIDVVDLFCGIGGLCFSEKLFNG